MSSPIRRNGQPESRTGSRVLVVSLRQVSRLLGYGSMYEFEDAIATFEAADRVDFATRGDSFRLKFTQRVNTTVRIVSGGRWGNSGPMPWPADAMVDRDYDLVLIVLNTIFDIRLLNLIRGARERSPRVAVYTQEVWPEVFEDLRVRRLPYRLIDHFFIGNERSVDRLAHVSGRPVTALPPGVDTSRFRPARAWSERAFDVCWTGRRMKPMHEDLLRLVHDHGWRYYYDAFGSATIEHPAEQRIWLATLLGDSRFAISHYSRVDSPQRHRGEHQLGARFLESSAAGNVLVGAPPNTRQYRQFMPWPDAVIPIAPDQPRVDKLLLELANDPDRMNAISRRNVAGSMRHNDWAHRWAAVLDGVGMDRGEALQARLAMLETEAARWDGPDEQVGRGSPETPGAAGRARRSLVAEPASSW